MCVRKAVALFSTSGVQQRWAVKISSLLDIPEPAKDDQFPHTFVISVGPRSPF